MSSRLDGWPSLPGWLVEELVDAARGYMGYPVEADCWAAAELERLLWDAWVEGRLVAAGELCSLLRGRRVLVAGGSESLILGLREAVSFDAVVAADGAAVAVAEEAGRAPEIIVGDGDGIAGHERLLDEAVLVLHVHGDNLPLAKRLAELAPRLAGIHQCPGRRSLHALPPLGFTDGDKAVALAVACGASELILVGMAFWERVGPWSKPWLRGPAEPWPEKRAKLRVAARIVEVLLALHRARGGSYTWLPSGPGAGEPGGGGARIRGRRPPTRLPGEPRG